MGIREARKRFMEGNKCKKCGLGGALLSGYPKTTTHKRGETKVTITIWKYACPECGRETGRFTEGEEESR